MEIFELIEACGCFLELLAASGVFADGIAWVRSKPNRVARKVAKETGQPPPEPDGWTTAWQILTPMAITLVILVILKWTRVIG